MNELVEGVDDLVGVTGGLALYGAGWADDTSLSASLIEVEKARRLLDATALHLLAEVDTRNLTDDTHGLVTSTWLSRDAHLPRPKCTRMLRFARALERFDQFDAALTKGEIGIDHLRVVVDLANPRILDAMVELQDLFLSMIPGRTFARWETEVRNIAALLDQDGNHDPDSDITANRLTITGPGPDTARLLNGQLVGTNGETVRQTLDHIADELHRQFTRDRDHTPDLTVPTRPVLLALALVEACRRAVARPVGSTEAPTTDLTIVIPASDDLDPVDLDDPDQRRPAWFGTHHTHTETLDGIRLTDDTTRLLCCDPALHAVIADTLGRPLDLGRRTRFATPAQRRAARTRDGGCVFPGCEAPSTWTDLHHVTPYPDGPTALWNLASLCRHHHTITHRNGWTMTATPDGWYHWTTPTGNTIWSQRHQHQRAGPTPDG